MATEFIYDNHKPALAAGFYKIDVTQEFDVDGDGAQTKKLTSSLTFKVAAEKYSISPQIVDGVFPPSNSMGNFYNVLPHISINRSTFPWERSLVKDANAQSDKPWVALLIFSEDEFVPLIDFENDRQKFLKNFSIKNIDDKRIHDSPFSHLLIGKNLLDEILSHFDEIAYLAHVRGNKEDEKAVIVANRLPLKNKKNFVHLVSLEECFVDEKLKTSTEDFYQFISLFNWEFFCTEHFVVTPEIVKVFKPSDPSLSGALKSLENAEFFNKEDFFKAISAKKKPQTPLTDFDTANLCTAFEVSHLNQILSHVNRTPATFRLPIMDDDDDLRKMGYLRMDYILESGESIEGAYRGPLLPNKPETDLEKNNPEAVLSGDKHFSVIGSPDVLDVSYAAAWELGRMLAIADKKFSTALFLWKRECYQMCKMATQDNASFPIDSIPYPDMPELVRAGFDDFLLLKNIPFHYLVPSEEYLPFESIRFFCIDMAWIHCLVDGAFSIGRFSQLDANIDGAIYKIKHPHLISTTFFDKENGSNQQILSGFLLRSKAVSGWPDMIIEGNSSNQIIHPIKTNLAPNLFFCRFNDFVDAVSIYQKPTSIHFGFEEDQDGKLFIKAAAEKKNVKTESNNRIKISTVYAECGFEHTAEFAAALIQKTEKVEFKF